MPVNSKYKFTLNNFMDGYNARSQIILDHFNNIDSLPSKVLHPYNATRSPTL